jgi:putative protease
MGACTHSCRWRYHIVEETRPGEYLPIEESERGTYIFNSKDLCMIEYIPELVKAGINSLKVEGRMKTALYVATVARTYRKAIDDFFEAPERYEKNKSWYMAEIRKGVNRQFTTGFFFGKPTHEDQIYDTNTYEKEYTYLGTICEEKNGLYGLEQKNKFTVGESIEIIKPDGTTIETNVNRITDDMGVELESCPHPSQLIYIDLGTKLEIFDILRRKE